MKKKGKVAIAVMLIVALLASMAFVSAAVSTHERGIDEEESYKIVESSQDLEDAVAGYNEAVTKGRLEDARSYVEKIDQIVAELDGFGMEVGFTETHENQVMPTTVSVTVNPATEQNQSRCHSISANVEQLETIKQLWGQDITIGEFMEKVTPEVLEDMPEEIAEHFYKTKMIWPDPLEPARAEDHPQAVVTEAFKPASESADVQPRIVILVRHYSTIGAEWPDIDFKSWSRVWLPHPWYRLPYMAVWSGLYYQDGSLKDFEFDDGYGVYMVEASGSYSTSTAGNYRVIGQHSGAYPPGYEPPGYYVVTPTDWIYVGP